MTAYLSIVFVSVTYADKVINETLTMRQLHVSTAVLIMNRAIQVLTVATG